MMALERIRDAREDVSAVGTAPANYTALLAKEDAPTAIPALPLVQAAGVSIATASPTVSLSFRAVHCGT